MSNSAVAKGKRFEREILNIIRQEVDGNAYQPSGSGNGLEKGDVIVPSKNLQLELKNQKTLMIMDWWQQCKDQVTGDAEPVVMFRNPRLAEFKETLVLIDLQYFLKLLNGEGEQGEKQFTLDYETRSALTALKGALSRVEKIVPNNLDG